MSGALALLQAWAAGLLELAGRVPEASALIAPGSWPLASTVGLCGLLLLVGGLRLGRLVAAAGAFLLGWILAGVASPLLAGHLPAGLGPWILGALLGAGAVALPAVFPLVAGALPGALLGVQLAPPGRAWMGAVGGAVVLALVAVVIRRLVVAASASAAGAALVATSLLALTPHVKSLSILTGRPTLLAALTATLAVAGTAFQLGRDQRSRAAGARRQAVKDLPAPPRE